MAFTNSEIIARCSARLFETIGPLIPKDRPVAVIDYPHAINCGDHAIWLGEMAFLAKLGVTIAYRCHAFDYDRDRMAASLGDGVILMQGGGNFGDLYPLYHELRLRVMADFPDNPVIVFPQQAAFMSDAQLNRTKALIGRHGNVTLIARDVATHHLMATQFGDTARVLMAPDMAMALGPLRRPCPPRYDIVWIARTDGEKITTNDPEAVAGLKDIPASLMKPTGFTDGLEMDYFAKQRPGEVLITDWYRLDLNEAVREALNALDYDAMSGAYLSRAILLLSLGRLVITDRLHAHILCVLLGVPHILLNNALGKNWNFYETWTRGSPVCRLQTNAADAWALARLAIEEAPPRPAMISGWSQTPKDLSREGFPERWVPTAL